LTKNLKNNTIKRKKKFLRFFIKGVSMEKKEMVNHPSHYGGDTEYECIKVLEAWNTPEEFVGFCKDNAIKYLCRAGKKDEDIQEYKKVAWYVNTLINYLEKNNKK
jgi:hypothetical protein